jgi:hypothetical protein
MIHGGMQANLRSGTGMDEVDAQHNYNLGTEYNSEGSVAMLPLKTICQQSASRVQITTKPRSN